MRYGAAERRTCQDGLAIHRRVPGLARDGLVALNGPLQRMELNRALMAARLTMHAAGLLPHASLGPPGSGQAVELSTVAALKTPKLSKWILVLFLPAVFHCYYVVCACPLRYRWFVSK